MILSLRYGISSGQEHDGFQFTEEVRHLYVLIIFVCRPTFKLHEAIVEVLNAKCYYEALNPIVNGVTAALCIVPVLFLYREVLNHNNLRTIQNTYKIYI